MASLCAVHLPSAGEKLKRRYMSVAADSFFVPSLEKTPGSLEETLARRRPSDGSGRANRGTLHRIRRRVGQHQKRKLQAAGPGRVLQPGEIRIVARRKNCSASDTMKTTSKLAQTQRSNTSPQPLSRSQVATDQITTSAATRKSKTHKHSHSEWSRVPQQVTNSGAGRGVSIRSEARPLQELMKILVFVSTAWGKRASNLRSTFMNTAKTIFAILVTASAIQLDSGAATPPSWRNGLQLALSAGDINVADSNQVDQQAGTIYVKDWLDPITGQHATQSSPANRPIYVPNALAGQPVLQFDGVNDFLTTTLPQIWGDKSIFIVLKRANTQPTTEISSSGEWAGAFLGANPDGGFTESEGRLWVAHDLRRPSQINKFILKSYIRNGLDGTLRVNGAASTVQVPDSAYGNYTISDAYYFFFPGQIAEILIYNRAVGEAERQSIERYLSEKYKLPVQPPPITTGLQLRLATDTIDTTDLSQVVQLNGSTYVKDWLDTSGNGYHAVQATANKQPGLIPNYLNGKPVVQFYGGGQFLATTLPQITGDKTIFIVQRRVGTQLRTELSSTAGGSGMFFSNASGAAVETEGRLYGGHDLQLPGNMNKFILKTYIRSGSTGTLMVNDAATSAQIPDSAAGNYTLSDPYSFFFSGFIAELLIYNRALAESERQAIENYLSEKYALWDVALSIRAGLQLWLRPDALDLNPFWQVPQGRKANGNIYVSRWVDSSAAGKDATQSAADYQPQIVYNAQQGRPVLRFDGANDFLSTGLPQIAGDKSIFIVQKRATAQATTEISSSTQTSGMFLAANPSGGFAETEGRLYVAHDLQLPSLINSFVIKSYIRSGLIGTLRVDDTAISAQIPDSASGNYTISGLPFPFAGDIAEVLVYNRAVTALERPAIEDYLADKWSNPADNVSSVAQDLHSPPMTVQAPGAGLRVKQTSPEYAQTSAYHALYLPNDWQPGRKYPIIVEYAGNGYNVEDAALGYGISGGSGFIWIGMPTIGGTPLSNQALWWGNLDATKDYCLKTLRHVCEDYGGDPSSVILTGHSRGGIACNYVGLNDDNIADAWLAFIPHSGYDGTYLWGYAGDDPASAYTRLQRLKGRAQHISQDTAEVSPWNYLRSTGIDMTPFSFRTLPFSTHTDQWALRAIQLRRDVRGWVQQILATRPGTHSITGRVTDSSSIGIPGARVQTGYTHFTYTDANGAYELAGLIDSNRTVTATAPNYSFAAQTVIVAGANLSGVNFSQ